MRFGYRGVPTVTFRLKTPIKIDQLLCVEFFDFDRKYTMDGEVCTDVIGCKIRGLKPPPTTHSNMDEELLEEGVKIVKVEGCEYRISEEEIIAWLSLYGEVVSEIEEDFYVIEHDSSEEDDGDTSGSNRSGIYSVKVKLDRDIPYLLPMCGKRIKIYYRGVQRLCPVCFGKHPKKVCQSRKVSWIDYVKRFIERNEDIPLEFYGKFVEVLGLEKDVMESTQETNAMVDQEMTDIETIPLENGSKQQGQTEPTTSTESQEIKEGYGPEVVESEKQKIPERPDAKDFNIPENKEQLAEMVDGMIKCGMFASDAHANIKSRRMAFNKATKEYDKAHTQQNVGPRKTTRGRKLTN